MSTPFNSSASSSPPATSRKAIEQARRRASRAASRSRCCSAPPAPARRSPPPTSSPQLSKPTLVLAHNKTLAAQLYKEFKGFFPHNAVHYFVSYYDYYQPEAYIPQRDIYIEKDASINENIDRLRLAATSALVSREDVIIVASVSCIYGLGSPSDYKRMMVHLAKGEVIDRDNLLLQAGGHPVPAQRHRLRARQVPRPRRHHRGLAGVRGVRATASSCSATRSTRSPIINPTQRRDAQRRWTSCTSTRPSTSSRRRSASSEAVEGIEQELDERLEQFKNEGKLLEARAARRPACRYDLEMLREVGYCSGHRELRPLVQRPQAGRAAVHAHRLLPRRLPDDRGRVARHAAAGPRHVRRRPQPQGDAGRARLPPAQRPRQPAAAVRRVGEADRSRCLFMSATPGPYELETDRRRGGRAGHPADGAGRSGDPRQAGPRAGAGPGRARSRSGAERRSATLVTTLTKRLAEDLTNYFREAGLRVQVAALANSTPSSACRCCASCARGRSTCWSA